MNVHLVSMGCDKNLVDSEYLLGLLQEEGCRITSEPETAEIILVNTCGFIADATQESIETILELSDYKKSGRCKVLIAAGCMAQRYKEEIFTELPEVNAVIGPGDYPRIGDVLRECLSGKQVSLLPPPQEGPQEYGIRRVLAAPSHFAYLKIAEGCDNRCTYCTIPSIRGPYHSRKMEDLLEEARWLADQGVRELILVAQDTALYGKDLAGESQLHILLSNLCKIPDLYWIRILYCYPEHLTDETIQVMAENTKICHYLDIPIQHSEDAVLKKMGRRSTREGLLTVIKKLRQAMPDITLRTTLITGFPSESEEQFEGLLSFINEVQFDRLGVFAYSQEEGTPAALLPDQIPEDEKQRRKNVIMETQGHISYDLNQKKLDQELEVIVDGYLPEENVYCARSRADSYEVDGMVYFTSSSSLSSGDFVTVRITECSEYDLKGELL